MSRDVQAKMKEDGFNLAYWKKTANYDNKPLSLTHIIPSGILCTVGLGIATIAFAVEKILGKKLTQRSWSDAHVGMVETVNVVKTTVEIEADDTDVVGAIEISPDIITIDNLDDN